MFGYVEKTFNEKMEELKKERELQNEEVEIYRQKRSYIQSYNSLKDNIKNLKQCLIAPSALVIIPILFCMFANYNVGLLFASGIGVFFDGIFISELVQKQKEIKKNYSDISSLSKEQISCEEQLLDKILTDYYHAGNNLDMEIINIKNVFKEIAQYKEGLEAVKQPEYQADTEEEYNFLKQSQEENLNLFAEYLDEKIDCSSVHFDNGIGEYTEDNKKLMKKM